jgi:hypothetical protein
VRGVMNNHNTMQLWSVAGAIWMLYRATRRDSMTAWAALGFFCGCAFLTKYSALVQFAAFFLYLLLAGHLRRAAVWKGIALATVILLAMVTPHLLWLKQQAAGPIAYAGSEMVPYASYLEELKDLFSFGLTNFGRIAALILAVIVVAIWAARQYRKKSAGAPRLPTLASELAASDRFFILFIGLAPLLLTVAIAGLMKIPLAAHWATTFFILFGFFAFWLLRTGDDVALLRKTVIVIIAMQVTGAAGYGLARGPLADKAGRPGRATFPGAEISRQVHAQWDAHIKAPLTVVASDTWLGGNIAIHAGPQVDVLIDGDVEKSQWVTPARAAACGMLLAINRSADAADGVPPKVAALMTQANWRGILQLPATKKMDGPQLKIEWGIIAPTANCPGKR